jgi:pilus assembly protein Flp/PilA
MELIQKLWNDESGATMVEYALMVALIAVVAVGAVIVLGTNVNETFEDINTRAFGGED